jgi:hypothetical protein
MKKFTITFNGRKAGAIGIMYDSTVTVEAKDKTEALLKLYDDYEHVRVIGIEVSND